MKFILSISIAFFAILNILGQGTLDDYKRAEKFVYDNVQNQLFNSYVQPNFTNYKNNFWYKIKTRNGTEFIYVDSDKRTKQPAFDHLFLAKQLNEILEKDCSAYELPFSWITYSENDNLISFKVDTLNFELILNPLELRTVKKEQSKRKKTESISPDKKFTAFIKDFNLYVKNNETGDEKQLSKDGRDKYDYAATLSWYYMYKESENSPYSPEIEAYWSPDSKKLIVPKTNRDHSKKLYMYKTQPENGFRADVISYERPLAGDSLVTTKEYALFDIESGEQFNIDVDPFAEFLSWGVSWTKDSKSAYITLSHRGYHTCDIIAIDGENGKSRIVHREATESYFDINDQIIRVLDKSNEFIWASEKDGWHHIYLHDWKTGEIKNQITKGDFFVRSIEYIDENNRKIYFLAGGVEENRDPYYRHLYVINFDGTGQKLLTSEYADHNIRFTKNGKYFVDNFSNTKQPNIAVLRKAKNGKIVLTLEKQDIDNLVEMGWTHAEPFVVKGRDGKTDVYGIMYKPTNFDPNKKYPVIDGTYSGPQTIRTPKSFRRAVVNYDLSLAELGFIVVTVDGFGSAYRSKEFHDYSYKNLGDIGAPDHILAIKQLARKYPFMDSTRVGIYGHSAGGYDATRALLAHPDFYKVGVSTAGNHDHRIAKAWWPELYMGYPAGKHYDEQSNFVNAHKLEGDLLLIHGDLDNNVNPTASMRMANALIEANKDFELLIIPNKDHSTVYYDKYAIRKRWDFFVKHLLNQKPPKEFKIK